MNVLHLTSDWKFTGPAEPMLIAGAALRSRGHRVDLVCPAPPDGEAGVRDVASDRGVPLEESIEIERARGVALWRDSRDARALRSWMSERAIDVVHVWHSRAHGLALRARGAGTALVRAHSDGPSRARGLRGAATRWMLGRGCDALVCTSGVCAASHGERGEHGAVRSVVGAVDLERFRPLGDVREREEARALVGLGAEAPVIGVVARVQPQRRFGLVFDALERVRSKFPSVRLVVVGRGTQIESVAHRPVAERGLGDNVVFAGQRTRDYAELLRGFDVLLFLVPGSDGGCRTVLEAAASGVPVVSSLRGALPELVLDGTTGYCVEEDATAVSAALEALLGAAEHRADFAAKARAHAERAFAPERLAEDLEAVYQFAVSRRRR